MRPFGFFLILSLICGTACAQAQGREALGWGRLLNNDVFGDGQDRWQTGSGVVSKVTGPGWNGALPGRAGDIVELRFRGGIVAPANLVNPAPGDRRYAAMLSLGAHTHFELRGAEISLGVDLVVTGPQTGLPSLQREIHKLLDQPMPTVLGAQIPNGIHPTFLLEAGRSYEISPSAAFRPFVELQAGVETLARIGADLHFGLVGRDELLLRDGTTGQRYRAIRGAHVGWAAVLGGDIAHVLHSTYLPASSGYSLTDARTRLRAGVHWQGENSSVFYGLTWLGEEFTAQPEGQVVGSMRLNIAF
ncbi:MAG: lipid A deacylase LpxR family protein [Rhodobacteraceae bacterium]|nr:lipid A deacylase LpxR family protein [Paracoccaceae bacterium]